MKIMWANFNGIPLLLSLLSILLIGILAWLVGGNSENAQLTVNDTPTPVHVDFPIASSLIEANFINVASVNMIDVAIDDTKFRVILIGLKGSNLKGEDEASEAFNIDLVEIVQEILDDTQVFLEMDVTNTDSEGRLERYVWLNNGTMLNSMLVATGFAQVEMRPPNVKYAARLNDLEILARLNGWGRWMPGKVMGNE